MKKFLNALFLTLLAVFTFSSCSDVPAPYDILGEGDVPGLTGDGSKDNPYTVSDLKAKADGTTVAWVQAYIVAGIKSSTDMSISSENDVVFGTQPTDVKATAFLIADDRGESDYKNCSAVNLSGKTAGCSEVKAALNLVDNATTPLPRLVTLKGTLVKNTWGLPGLKEVTTAILEDGTVVGEGGDEPTPPVGGVTFFEESFASDKGAFTIEDKTRPTKVSEIWKWESYTPEGGTASTYMKASAYISATEKEASESWLISPVVNLTKATKASLTFEHAHKFCGDPAKELTIWVKESTASDWTQATIPTYGTNQNWTFVSSGNIDLASYIGKNIQFAFKYISTTSAVGTWEVKNVKIIGEGEGGGEQPTPPGEEGTKIFVETFGTVTANTNVEGYTGWSNSDFTFSVNNAKVNLRTILHKTEANKTESTEKINHIWFPNAGDNTFTISNINAAGYNKFVLYYEEAANTYDVGSSIDLNVLKIKFNGTEVVADSKIVTATVKAADANIFYEMQVELNVEGTANSTLEFSALAADNTLGLRLANIRLYAVGEGGGTEPEPTGNLLTNSGFENWTADTPDDWARVSVTSANTWEKSTDAYNNSSYSILIKGNTSNNRFGAKEVQLEVGKYTIDVYAKIADSASSGAKLKTGIVPINEVGSPGTYNYGETTQTAFELTDSWAVYTNTIEVKAAGLYSVFLVNAKSGSNKNVLLDDVTLRKAVE
jgi:hypothetical protein